MVDGARRGWRDNSGIFSKTTVEERILHMLNERLRSGFENDANTKKFTATDEVWDAYLASHPKDTNLRYGECPDYADLAIAVGNGVAVGKNSIGLGIATDANTLGEDETRDARIEDLMFDPENDAFVALSQDEPPSSGFTPPSGLPEVSEISTQRPKQPKRSRTQYEATSGSSEKIMEEIKTLFGEVQDKTPLEDTRHICIEEMVATFLIIVGQNDRYCNVRQRFSRSHFATSQNFNKALKALNTIAPDMMIKPSTAIPAKIQESTRFMPFFKNVLAVCNFDLQFIYVLSWWEGSAHDSKLLSDALSRRNGLQVPQGKYFLVDCGFANRRQFLAPLRGVQYHLKDFGGQGRHPRNAKLVLACAGLHNFLRKEWRSDEFPVENEGDQDVPPLDTEEENAE
ncbi:hypothetical protein C2S53_002302 [Perilla frutescens var. hirtella]|uniref:DDE Tnp4 domain-containing protein n=1 Tax=Perilla frutescens var. hirtella TaxID=608512 RepID=A0AAD4J307_PERFH|nr:hypothetical protein C2S53_002302 [Perilla frutescens var. hirtella]